MIRAASGNKVEFGAAALGETDMGYVDRNLVPGETLLYRTRHHWLVLMGPFFGGLLLLVPGIALMAEAIATRATEGPCPSRLASATMSAASGGSITIPRT